MRPALGFTPTGRTWPSLQAVRWFQVISAANPLTYVSEGLRGAMIPAVPHIAPWVCSAVLLGSFVVLMAIGVRAFDRRAVDCFRVGSRRRGARMGE